jgi:hypothetical protein
MRNYTEDDLIVEPKKVQKPAWRQHDQEIGCGFCWDSRKRQDIELYFFDKANNLRLCTFCPSCGRPFNTEV